jgi:hypothetical protein
LPAFKDWIEHEIQAAQRDWVEALPVELPPARFRAAFGIFDANKDSYVDSLVSCDQLLLTLLYTVVHILSL